MNTNNIVFIGFMGCGKSSIGTKIAKNLHRLFIDTDDIIEKSENKSIKNIFRDNNQEYFRKCEQKVFDFLMPTSNACISTGGGFPIHINQPINKLGTVIYLDKSLDNIISSLNEQERNQRPLFNNPREAKELYKHRINIYKEKSDIIVNINNKSVDTICHEIQEIII